MSTSLKFERHGSVSYLLLIFGTLFVSIVTLGAALVFGPEVGIKGSYSIFGMLGALFVHYISKDSDREADPLYFYHKDINYLKIFFSVYLLFLAVGALYHNRVVVLIPMLIVGYGIIGVQLYRGDAGPVIPFQAALLLAVSPIIKYVSTGLYFGNVDILKHIRWSENLVQFGNTALMGETWYQTFAGLHITVGTTSLTTGLGEYEALYILGLTSFGLLPITTYCFSRTLGKDKLFSSIVSVVVTVVPHLSFYASYFFPQSMTVVLMIFIIYLLYRIPLSSDTKGPFVTAMAVMTLAAMFTHHLTFVLFIPLFLLLVVSTLGSNLTLRDRHHVFSLIFVAALWIGEIYLLLTIGQGFTKAFIGTFLQIANIGFRGGRVAGEIYLFGVDSGIETVATSLSWLVGPYGIYFGTLLLTLVLGLLAILFNWDLNPRMRGIYAVGAIGSIMILKTPIPVKSRLRIGLVFVIFFAFIIGNSLQMLIEDRSDSFRVMSIAVVILIILGTLAPLIASPAFYNIHSRSTTQSSFSKIEYRSLERTSQFVNQFDMDVSAVWLTRQAMFRFGTSTRWALANRSGIRFKNFLIYRTEWKNHLVNVKAGPIYFSKVLMSDDWLRDRIARGNKVYTAGKVGIISNPRSDFD